MGSTDVQVRLSYDHAVDGLFTSEEAGKDDI